MTVLLKQRRYTYRDTTTTNINKLMTRSIRALKIEHFILLQLSISCTSEKVALISCFPKVPKVMQTAIIRSHDVAWKYRLPLFFFTLTHSRHSRHSHHATQQRRTMEILLCWREAK